MAIERHVTPNQPGVGWYWEVIQESTIVIARGLASTRAEAEAQAAEAEQNFSAATAAIGSFPPAPLTGI